MVLSKICWADRIRLVGIALGAVALALIVLPVRFATPVEAKTPGKTYCFHRVCHRVKTIAETEALVGREESLVASHYDDCTKDRFNPCGLTSSGEMYHPGRPDNTASPIYPDGTTLLVWNPKTARALVLRVNNAGPYYGNRKLDVSRAAAERLGFGDQGLANLRVRVVKAPEPEEARYSKRRTYPPVLGDIGEYASLDRAHRGMGVALALQATATSPLAPVTANVFSLSGSELRIAEAPQALGRGRLQRASERLRSRVALFGFGRDLNQSMSAERALVQSRSVVASLAFDHQVNRSVKGDVQAEEYVPPAKPDAATGAEQLTTARAASNEEAGANKADRVARTAAGNTKKQRRQAAQPKKRKKVASRRSRSRSSSVRNGRKARPAPVARRPVRSAGDAMALNIRARSAY